jgi:hypothetical protein
MGAAAQSSQVYIQSTDNPDVGGLYSVSPLPWMSA